MLRLINHIFSYMWTRQVILKIQGLKFGKNQQRFSFYAISVMRLHSRNKYNHDTGCVQTMTNTVNYDPVQHNKWRHLVIAHARTRSPTGKWVRNVWPGSFCTRSSQFLWFWELLGHKKRRRGTFALASLNNKYSWLLAALLFSISSSMSNKILLVSLFFALHLQKKKNNLNN